MEESVQVACMSGAGMDRHILAWKLIAAENNLPVPSITETEAYKHMTHFQVSTSQVRFLTQFEVKKSRERAKTRPVTALQ